MRAGARQVLALGGPGADFNGTEVSSAIITQRVAIMRAMFQKGRIIYKTDMEYLATQINNMIGHYHTFEDYIQVAAYGGVYGDDGKYGGGPYPNRGGSYGRGEDTVMGSRDTGARNVNSSVNRQVAAFGTGGLNSGTIDAEAITVAIDACNALRSHDHNVADAYGNNAWDPNSY
jgi:hypothetical protein